jgi:hypothetical protein
MSVEFRREARPQTLDIRLTDRTLSKAKGAKTEPGSAAGFRGKEKLAQEMGREGADPRGNRKVMGHLGSKRRLRFYHASWGGAGEEQG